MPRSARSVAPTAGNATLAVTCPRVALFIMPTLLNVRSPNAWAALRKKYTAAVAALGPPGARRRRQPWPPPLAWPLPALLCLALPLVWRCFDQAAALAPCGCSGTFVIPLEPEEEDHGALAIPTVVLLPPPSATARPAAQQLLGSVAPFFNKVGLRVQRVVQPAVAAARASRRAREARHAGVRRGCCARRTHVPATDDACLPGLPATGAVWQRAHGGGVSALPGAPCCTACCRSVAAAVHQRALLPQPLVAAQCAAASIVCCLGAALSGAGAAAAAGAVVCCCRRCRRRRSCCRSCWLVAAAGATAAGATAAASYTVLARFHPTRLTATAWSCRARWRPQPWPAWSPWAGTTSGLQRLAARCAWTGWQL